MSAAVIVISITATDGEGVGVHVKTDNVNPHELPDSVGATWVGICMAINDYMRSHGAPTFDCLKRYTSQ